MTSKQNRSGARLYFHAWKVMHAVMQPAPKLKKPKLAELKKPRVDVFRKLLQPVEDQQGDAEAVADAEVVADS